MRHSDTKINPRQMKERHIWNNEDMLLRGRQEDKRMKEVTVQGSENYNGCLREVQRRPARGTMEDSER